MISWRADVLVHIVRSGARLVEVVAVIAADCARLVAVMAAVAYEHVLLRLFARPTVHWVLIKKLCDFVVEVLDVNFTVR